MKSFTYTSIPAAGSIRKKSGKKRTGSGRSFQKPLFDPKTTWELPKEFPNLKGEKLVALDTETCDPQLLSKGPGVRRDGYIIGISVAVPSGESWYFPFGHAEGKQFDKAKVIQWAKDNLTTPGQAKLGANIMYDLDYLYHEGVEVSGPFYDVQNAEPLINENLKTYSLDSLGERYLGKKKDERILEEACRNRGLKGKPQEHLWKIDARFTGEYAEWDAAMLIPIFEKQKKIMAEQELENIFDIETRLVPMLLAMRRRGVLIDKDRLQNAHDAMMDRLVQKKKELASLNGGAEVDYWAAEHIGRIFDRHNLDYPMTPKTNKPSFTKDWLDRHNHPISKVIVECRTLDKFIGTFLEGSIREMMVGDRIHGQFHQLKSDDHGTVTGRLSASTPNLQFIPMRDKELGPLCRSLFMPDPGKLWAKLDYSQIEIRILAHYARGPGADKVRQMYIEDPRADYHQWCADEAQVSRTFAKRINFGLIYGMGVPKLSAQLGIPIKEAELFLGVYFEKLPFLQETVQTATRVAETRGYIKTILGRRRRFDLWEPRDGRLSKMINANPDKKKIIDFVNEQRANQKEGNKYYPGVQRAGCYKAFNAADQGSAADIMKKSMVDVWESGVCEVIDSPLLTVHDELDFDFPKSKEGFEAVRETQRIMETTVELAVPAIVDAEYGENWGYLKDIKWGQKAVYGVQ